MLKQISGIHFTEDTSACVSDAIITTSIIILYRTIETISKNNIVVYPVHVHLSPLSQTSFYHNFLEPESKFQVTFGCYVSQVSFIL